MIDISQEVYYILASFIAGLLLGLRYSKTARDRATLKSKELRRELRSTKKQLAAIAAALH